MSIYSFQVRELLTDMGFNGDDVAVVKGSALNAVEGKNDEIRCRFFPVERNTPTLFTAPRADT